MKLSKLMLIKKILFFKIFFKLIILKSCKIFNCEKDVDINNINK